jgi:hypothetical protein
MAGEIYPIPGKPRNDLVIALGGTLVLALILFRFSLYAPVPPGEAPAASGAQAATASTSVEILAQDDDRVRPALAEVDALLAGYADRVRVVRYDPATEPGASFARAKGISPDAGLVIFVNGTQTFFLDGRSVTFESHPGSSRSWSVAQLGAVLQRVLGE